MKKIPLTQGHMALVDDEDFAALSGFTWHAIRNKQANVIYAVRTTMTECGKRAVRMHRQILGAQRGQLIDHRDRNGLNNQRENLRVCDHHQNAFNRTKSRIVKTSRFHGVSWYPPTSRWKAQIQAHGKKRGLGYFLVEDDAARAYDAAAREFHGAFAVLNFQQESNAS